MEKLSREDHVRYYSVRYRLYHTEEMRRALLAQLRELRLDLEKKYSLTDTDTVNVETGEILRTVPKLEVENT